MKNDRIYLRGLSIGGKYASNCVGEENKSGGTRATASPLSFPAFDSLSRDGAGDAGWPPADEVLA